VNNGDEISNEVSDEHKVKLENSVKVKWN